MLTNKVDVLIISIMAHKVIVYESVPAGQTGGQADCPSDGLRLLARMIARKLITRESGCKNTKKYQDAASQLKVATSLESKTNPQGRKAKQDA